MVPRERLLRAMKKEEVDRLPFWVKVFGNSYLKFQPEPFCSMKGLDLVDYLSLDHIARVRSVCAIERKHCTFEESEKDGILTRVYTTSDGILKMAYKFDSGSYSWHPVEYLIKDRNDLKRARHLFTGNSIRLSEEQKMAVSVRKKEIGDRGILSPQLITSPLMVLLQVYIGIENTYFFLSDYREEMEELMDLMHRENLQVMEINAKENECDVLVSEENTSTTLLSPSVFKKYCYGYLKEYGEIARAHGKFFELHMCGLIKALLPTIETLPVDSIEAFSAPPVGNTTITDGFTLCPSKTIIGGTCANVWLKEANGIIEWIETALQQAGKIEGLVLTSAGAMPPMVPIEKIKKVREHFLTFSGNY